MPTTRDNRDFREALFADDDEMLDRAIKLIHDNVKIEDVFPEDEIVEYVKSNLSPEDIFGRSELIEWALENNYVSKDG